MWLLSEPMVKCSLGARVNMEDWDLAMKKTSKYALGYFLKMYIFVFKLLLPEIPELFHAHLQDKCSKFVELFLL